MSIQKELKGREKSRANLISYTKNSPRSKHGGRPAGRKSLTTILQNLLDKKFTHKNPFNNNKKESKELGEWLNIILVAKALNKDGDLRAIQEIWDRIEGRAKQSIEMSGLDGKAIEVKNEIKEKIRSFNGNGKLKIDKKSHNDKIIDE